MAATHMGCFSCFLLDLLCGCRMASTLHPQLRTTIIQRDLPAPHSSPQLPTAPHGSAPNIIAGWVDVRQGQPASRASLGASSQLDNEGEANAPQVPFVASDRSVRFAMPGAESSVRIRSLLVNMFQELDSIQSLWAFGPGLEVGS